MKKAAPEKGLRELKAAQTQSKILKAAKEVLLASGYKNTTIALISKKAKVGYGTVYNYFGNKENLFMQVVYSLLEELNKILYINYSPSTIDEVFSTVYTQIHDVLQFASRNKAMLRIVWEAIGQSNTIANQWRNSVNAYIERVVEDITYSQNHGLARPLDKYIIAKGIVYLVLAFFWDIVLENEVDIARIADNISRLYLYGLYD
ncbi:MAG: TetR/AcrR family transcriptional regulator [Clostridia bacterium]|nr:TetR/AcrR family transcriptional regulator [Clostridia bacterium]